MRGQGPAPGMRRAARPARAPGADRRATPRDGAASGSRKRSALPDRAIPERRARRGHGASPRGGETARQGAPDPSNSLLTAANVVTLIRVVATFAWIAVALWVGPNDPARGSHSIPLGLLVAALYGAIAFTDTLDGYLARSRDEVTDFGKFLDPIADKLICIGSLLVLLDWGYVSVWVPVIIVFREFLVSGLRMVVAAKGEVVAASRLGKWKTGFTMGAIAGYLVAAALPQGPFESPFTVFLFGAAWISMAVAIVLTIWSGVDYFVKCRGYIL